MTDMFSFAAGVWPLAPADSARVAEGVYTASLLIFVPLVLALVAALALRSAAAGTRALVWRAAVVALLLVFAGRVLPASGIAWVVPDLFAAGLVVLGRMQLSDASHAAAAQPSLDTGTGAGQFDVLIVVALLAVYLSGVLLILARTWHAWRAVQKQASRATTLSDVRWLTLLSEARETLSLHRHVSLLVSDSEVSPATWGVLRPVILLPPSSLTLGRSQRRALLLHELAHVKAGDWLFGLAARLVCALYWFHPGAWYIAKKLRSECEVACDDRVLAAGIRASDYASLLMSSSQRLFGGIGAGGMAPSLHGRGGLRERIHALFDPARKVGAPRFAVVVATALLTVFVALPTATARLAPGREMLTGLMQDMRWESRAYAVRRLALRADSLVLAQTAAALDPSPNVRASARDALKQQTAIRTPYDTRGTQRLPSR